MTYEKILKNPISSNNLMYALHTLCKEIDKSVEMQKKLGLEVDAEAFYYVVGDIASLLLANKDNLEESDYKAIVKIINEHELDSDIPDEYLALIPDEYLTE